jgi:hypothetical protein
MDKCELDDAVDRLLRSYRVDARHKSEGDWAREFKLEEAVRAAGLDTVHLQYQAIPPEEYEEKIERFWKRLRRRNKGS